MHLSEERKGVIALIILAWVFATMGTFVRPLSEVFALFTQGYLRIGLAFLLAALLFAGSLSWSRMVSLPWRDWLVLGFRAISLYLGVALFTYAILNAKFGNAYFLANLPLLPLFGYFFLKERLRIRTLLYIGLGFIGTLLITVQDFSTLAIGHGELFALISMIFFDFSYVARRWHSEHLSDKESTVVMFLIGAIFLLLTALALGEPMPTAADFTPMLILILLGASLFNVVNLYLTNYGFKRVPVGVAGNIIALETVFALGYGIFLFHETPLIRELCGAALIAFSVFQINRKRGT